ncbi:MAG: DUF1574 family protein, partial [Spirochaetia bacterium]|nr:DUF1574 family protein [Spirochaetia bacterium]
MEEQKITRFRLFILFPLLVFAAAWLLDKQFFIGTFPDYYLRTGSFINYRHKLDLTDELQLYLAQPNRRKTLVIFGNSRTMAFDNAYIEKKYPDWMLFNFSVPGGTTDYFYYVLRRFKDKNIRPDFVVMAVTPQGFNASPASAMDEVMLEGLPVSFVLRYANRYSIDDLGNYFAKKLFWSYQYRPKPGVIAQRMENDALLARTYNQFRARTYVLLSENRGSTPGGQAVAPNEDY